MNRHIDRSMSVIHDSVYTVRKENNNMTIKIAENIKKLRKRHSLTQEQLAETLGVTVGAVYKWEAGLSTPEIKLIMELADFFEISVDVLLGYEQQNGKVEERIARLHRYIAEKNFEEAVLEAEKALKKYPNNFDLVYMSAFVYQLEFTQDKNEKAIERSNELFQHSISLLHQNTNKDISEVTIQNRIAENYLLIEKTEQALESLKQNNVCGINNSLIGLTYARTLKQPEEAKPYLIQAFANSFGDIIRTMGGMMMLDAKTGIEAISWSSDFLDSMKIVKEKIAFTDKLKVVLMAQNAIWKATLGQLGEARESIESAYALAKRFDTAPIYSLDGIKFFESVEGTIAYDDIGKTAMEAVWNTLNDVMEKSDAQRFVLGVWEELVDEEQ